MSEDNPEKRYKRKRKKNFLKNARKYAKKGCYGRGSQLDPDTYQYFVRIMEAYREGFDSDEDRGIFVNNVFEQTVDQEINCSCNQVGCRVIELLLPFSNEAVIERFIKAFSEELRPLCCDRFASHVLEALVRQTGYSSLKSDPNEFQSKCRQFVVKVSKFLLNNLEDYIWDTYGSHVIRTCLETMASIPKDTNKGVESEQKVEIPDEYAEIIKDYGARITSWPQFSELSKTETSSGFLQVLLKALKKTDKKLLKSILKKLLSDNFTCDSEDMNKDNLSSVFLSKPAMMVLESALEVANSKTFTQMYLHCFKDHLVKLATTRSTNFTVQKLIIHCKEKSEFELIFEEVAGSLKDIIKSGHTGIIWAIAQGCKTHTTKQGQFVQNLMKSLNCFEPEERQNTFIVCLSKFVDYESIQKEINLQKEKLNLHGTLTLQLLLEFNKPIKIINSLLNMDQNDLKGLFSNTMGSHIVDSYVKSVFVGEKSREKLTRKMQGVYQELAMTKYGSRSFEALWSAANLKTKLTIMEEMAYKDGAWANYEHGKIIASKINLSLYKRNKEEWKNSVNTIKKATDLFADILK